MRLRIVSRPWRIASSRSWLTRRSFITSRKVPAAWSSSRRSNEESSATTVRESFHDCGLASSTLIAVLPSRAIRLTAMPLRSSADLRSSAARSVWLATCRSASTPSIKWMPPCRSSPRLIELFNGYRYQTETAMTARTRPMRSRRCLGILLALPCRHAADGGAVEFELDLVGDPQGHGVLVDPRHGAVQSAGGHHAVAPLDRPEHLLALLLLLLLRAQQQEVEDREHGRDHDDRRQHALRAAARRRPGREREIREEHRLRRLRKWWSFDDWPRETSTDDTA